MSKQLNWSKNKSKVLTRKREREFQEAEARRKRMHEHAVKEGVVAESVKVVFAAPPPIEQGQIISRAETIMPEMAIQWLDGQVHNRALNHVKAMSYADDMKNGRWDLNGEPIIFDWNMVLQDGQHRLWACIESKTPFISLVTRGVDPATFRTIDTGRARKASDVLSIEHYRDTTALAATASIVIDYQIGSMRSGRKRGQVNHIILDFIKRNPDLVDWVAKARRHPTVGVATALAAVCYIAKAGYPAEADRFLQAFKTGENLTVGSPILTVRNRLLTEKGLRRDEKVELIVKAWNAYIDNRMMLSARTSPTSEFPRIKGDLRV